MQGFIRQGTQNEANNNYKVDQSYGMEADSNQQCTSKDQIMTDRDAGRANSYAKDQSGLPINRQDAEISKELLKEVIEQYQQQLLQRQQSSNHNSNHNSNYNSSTNNSKHKAKNSKYPDKRMRASKINFKALLLNCCWVKTTTRSHRQPMVKRQITQFWQQTITVFSNIASKPINNKDKK